MAIGHRPLVVALLFLLFGSAKTTAQQTAVIGRNFPGSPRFFYDADGAAGPSHYAEITNAGFRVTALSTGTVAYSSTSLFQFWNTKVGLPLTGCCYDPQLEYDHATGRWIAVSLSGVNSADSAIYLGISDTSDPSGGWKGLVIDADPSNLRWADIDYLGLDGSAVYITSGLPGIVSTTPFRLGLYVLPKSDLLGATPTAVRMSRFLTMYPPAASDFYYGANPQIDYLGTATDGLHIAAYSQPTSVFTGSGYRWAVDAVYERMTGQASGAATLLPWAITPSYQFDSSSNPAPQSLPADAARQPGTSVRLNNGGGQSNNRVGDAVYSVTSAPVLGRLGILWRRFQPSTNTIVDAGFIGDAVNDYLAPSIAANAKGDAVIAYARTGPASYASFYCSAGQPDASGKLVFGPPTLVKAGSDIYDENGPVKSPGVARFIDYASSVSVQPLDPSRFWISGPYVSGRNIGSTWIAEVIVGGALIGTGIGAFNPSQAAWLLDSNGNYTWDGTPTDFYHVWGSPNNIPVVGDWTGDGIKKIGVFNSSTGIWLLDMNGNGLWDGPVVDKQVSWGSPGDIPVVGNWNGLGVPDKLGTFNPNQGTWLLDFNGNFIWDGPGTDKFLAWGSSGDKPVVGDWNGSGTAKIGIFNPTQGWWLLDYNGNYAWEGAAVDRFLKWGSPGDTPVVGDWNGTGATKIGIFNSSQAVWLLDYNGNYTWDGAATDKFLAWGSPGDKPVVGDWNGSGTAKIAVFNPSQGWWVIDYNGNYVWEGTVTDRFLKWGSPGDTPLVGKW